MENDNLGPVGERDDPPECIPAPKSYRNSRGSRVGTTRVGISDVERSDAQILRCKLPADSCSWDAREQCLERRRIFEKLRQHYERKKKRRENFPRPDLTAMKQMREEGLLFKFEDIGDVPGVIIGDQFHYRSEMIVVGMHHHTQAGISYDKHDGELLATCIVASGGYEDDKDYGRVLHYSGQGGNDYKGEKRQVEDQKEDQKRKHGNEAMMNSYRLGKPVRVIRGHNVESITNGWNKIYSYDGLYTIFYGQLEVGTSGHQVYKFKLERNPNQPQLKIRTVQFQGLQMN